MHIFNFKYKMAKEKSPQTVAVPVNNRESSFPVPVSIEEFRDDILTLFLMQVRTVAWMTDAETALRIVEKTSDDSSELFNPELDNQELGLLTYEDIRNTLFARCLETLYQYAYFGILDESIEPLAYEGIYTWMSAILSDMRNSRFLEEWESFGGLGSGSAATCLHAAELANARRVLEGGQQIFYFRTPDGGYTPENALNVRQMALLAGMEEMSIRAAANPKRANPLPTYSEEGRTLIAIDAAKAWLQAKGRYVPQTRQWASGEIDLTKRKFTNSHDIYAVIHDRRNYVTTRHGEQGELLESQFAELGKKYKLDLYVTESLSNIDFVRELAGLLEFPVDLFVLRVKEALTREELARVERQLRELAQQSA